MKLPKPNRFGAADAERAAALQPSSPRAPEGEGVVFLVVTGQVAYEGDRASSVVVFGVNHAFDENGHVTIAGLTHQLIRTADGVEQLAPIS